MPIDFLMNMNEVMHPKQVNFVLKDDKFEFDIEDAANKDPLKSFREFMKREGL